MDNKVQFQSILTELLNKIEENENFTEKDLVEYLAPMSLTETQIDMVAEYIKSKKEERKLSAEEVAYLEEYEESLSYLKQEKEGEKEQLLKLLVSGKSHALDRLVELYLKEIITVAKKEKVPGVLLEDLIQEGNLGLTLAIKKWTDTVTKDQVDKVLQEVNVFDDLVMDVVLKSIRNYVSENTDYKKQDDKVIHKVMELNECLTNLEKKLGRKVMIDELAAQMKLEEDEVLDILKLAGENLEEDPVS